MCIHEQINTGFPPPTRPLSKIVVPRDLLRSCLVPAHWRQKEIKKMAASVLDGQKLCEVSGNVRWSSMAQAPMSIQSGSLAVYKLSDSFYIHARTTAKRGKVRRCSLNLSVPTHLRGFLCRWREPLAYSKTFLVRTPKGWSQIFALIRFPYDRTNTTFWSLASLLGLIKRDFP